MKTGKSSSGWPGMRVRPCAVCGTFYPATAGELASTIDALIAAVSVRERVNIRGIIAPHAGYTYSGLTAARAYARLAGAAYDSVVVVAPSHREYLEGVSVYDGDAYATPLGILPIDETLRAQMVAASPLVRASATGHRGEHAVEVQLPFLQRMLGEFSLLPLVMGSQAADVCIGLGEALATVLRGRSALLVASTDLSHFYPLARARALDDIIIEDVREFDERALLEHLGSGTAEACGGGPAAAVMTALKRLGSARMDIVDYATSGDVTGDQTSVVGYLSAVAI